MGNPDDRDEWGLTEADQDELRALMSRTDRDQLQTIIVEVAGTPLMFPPVEMWRELLGRLRELTATDSDGHTEKGGA
jgi:hypothetical protein